MEFRKDINGLRALAVLAVIVFHYSHSWVPGGFAGVDVFFVISGFLMTKIIFTGIDKGTFRLVGFYFARAKRIIPALSFCCLLLFIVGYLFLSPKDFILLSEDAMSSIIFVSNFLFLSRAGYFDESSLNSFLLHTWSLSVEWQFYIIYPIIILTGVKLIGIELVKKSILPVTIILFSISVWRSFVDPESAYFMFYTRAWEMMVGGLALTTSNKFIKEKPAYFEVLGLVFILLSYFIFSESTLWPGYAAFLPVFGAFIIISANGKLPFLSNFAMQYVGKISYSVYLFHWPIIVLFRKLNIHLGFVTYVILTLAIASFAYYAVEKRRLRMMIVTALVVVPSLMYANANKNEGYSNRIDPEFRLNEVQFHQKYYGGSGFPANTIFFINSNKDNFEKIIFGDSFAMQYARNIKNSGAKFGALFDHGCPVFPNYSRYAGSGEDISCSVEYDKAKTLMGRNKNAPVYIAQDWMTYQKLLVNKGSDDLLSLTFDDYQKIVLSEVRQIISDAGSNRPVNIIGTQFKPKFDAFSCIANNNLPGFRLFSNCTDKQEQNEIAINSSLKKLADEYKNVTFIDPNDALCQSGKCLLIKSGQPVFSDSSHLSVYGAEIVVKSF